MHAIADGRTTRIYHTGRQRRSPNSGPEVTVILPVSRRYWRKPSGAETTNIRMEGFAIIAALKHAIGEPCEIYSDSEFGSKLLPSGQFRGKRNTKKSGGHQELRYRPGSRAIIRRSPPPFTFTGSFLGPVQSV